MSCCSNEGSVCPCGQFVHPAAISNLPGLSEVSYRVGDYTTFRHALLRALAGETCLTRTVNGEVKQIWRPGAEGDLAVQMMEWWAYLADILTFYNERTANQAYLRTANLPETVKRLIRILGYRPKPAMGAYGNVAAIVSGAFPVTLPQSFQIQSKPGPGQQAQTFESESPTTVVPAGVIPVDPPPGNGIQYDAGASTVTVFVKGVLSGAKTNENLLLLNFSNSSSGGQLGGYAYGSVQSITPCKDPRGNPYTEVILNIVESLTSLNAGSSEGFQLLRSTQSMRLNSLCPFMPPKAGASTATVNLETIARQIVPGDTAVLTCSKQTLLTSVSTAANQINYVTNPNPPPGATPLQIPIPYTQLAVNLVAGDPTQFKGTSGAAYYAWTSVGELIDPPATRVCWQSSSTTGYSQVTLSTVAPAVLPTGNGQQQNVFLEDANGLGVEGEITFETTAQSSVLMIIIANSAPAFTLPLRLLLNLVPVNCGKTVTGEVLGTGNGAILGQDFILQKTPVTYVQSGAAASLSGDGFSSTVQIWVNGIEWTEVPTLYDQPPTAQVFATEEDEQGQTHVKFGTRLPTGATIVANYRFGGGANSPSAGSLVTIMNPLPGLGSIRNPVAVGGGADADSPSHIQQLAPQSVLTFNRAVSLDDFEAIAGTANGVTRVKAVVGFNGISQRPRITIWVGDDSAAVGSAQTALAGACDPNNVPSVMLATEIDITITATIIYDPKYDPDTLQTAIEAALVDADTGMGLFGPKSIGIGEGVYDSQIYAACMVPGVISVQDLVFSPPDDSSATDGSSGTRSNVPNTNFLGPAAQPQCTDHFHDPRVSGFFVLDPNTLEANLTMQSAQTTQSS